MKWLLVKIKAGALQYSLFVGVLTFLIVSSFLLLTYLQQQFKQTTEVKIKTIQNADLGFTYAQHKDLVPLGASSLQLDDNYKSELSFSKKTWGIFDVLKVKSTAKNDEFTKMGLLGGQIYERPALYLKDNNKPLVVVGDTRIEGVSYLPEKYVKRGNIAGKSYYQKQLLFGPSVKSAKELPKVDNLESIKTFVKELPQKSQEYEPLELYEGIQMVHSFLNSTKYYNHSGDLLLTDVSLSGNMILHSNTSITIDNSAHLVDVILIAPEISVKRGFTGNIQAITTKRLTVEQNCQLNYPSALILMDDEKEEVGNDKKSSSRNKSENKELIIADNSSVSGLVVYLSENKKTNYFPQLIIEENAQVIGEVYCEANLELQGNANGSVYSNSFLVRKFGSVYQNHIYNGKIISAELPTEFVGLQLVNSKNKVAKWLY